MIKGHIFISFIYYNDTVNAIEFSKETNKTDLYMKTMTMRESGIRDIIWTSGTKKVPGFFVLTYSNAV